MHGKLQGVIEMLRNDRARRLGQPLADGGDGEQREEAESPHERLAELEREYRRACETCVAQEDRLTDLASQLVALERLHGTIDRGEVLGALQEIVINLVGCEELALFTPVAGGQALRPELSFGVDAARLDAGAAGAGPIGRAAAGRSWIAGHGPALPDCAGLSACVPLVAGGAVVGVLVLWSLLQHKPDLSDRDRGLLERIAIHGGIALHLTAAAGARRGAAGAA
jgi:hypothetical protein